MNNQRMWLLRMALALVLGFCLAGPAVADPIPPIPQAFHGPLYLGTEHEQAPAGKIVKATCAGVVTGTTSNPITTTVDGYYGDPDPLGIHLVVQGEIVNGAPIEFYVDEIKAQCREAGAVTWLDSYPFTSGATTELELWVDVPPEMDFGDAPEPTYPTLLVSNGARHVIDGVTFLGTLEDAELDGQPNATATGDDLLDGNDDEDGVVFTTQLMPGVPASVDVTASVAGLLNAWIDFNADGDWADAGEQVFTDQPLVAGLNNLAFQVPAAAVQGTTYARFRFSTLPGLLCYGLAPDGEVEDYEIRIEPPQDFGDTPDPTYPTLLASNGARHTIVPGFFLGNGVDAELDGQPNATATGDDLLDGNDDEDGVAFTTDLCAGAPARVDVTASVAGLLNAWIDFNADGDWADAGEQVFADEPLVAGVNDLVLQIPSSANVSDPAFARFRFSTVGGLSYDGLAPDGEVEDYQLQVDPPVFKDWGDAPDPYPTLLGNNGAVHWIVTGIFLGNSVDEEADGQPDPVALGDDNQGVPDDEDGVAFTTPLIVGRIAGVDVTASVAGLLNAWIDFNGDGDWDDPFEQISADEPLVAGVNGLTFPVPTAAVPGFTISRFRFSILGGLPYTGLASDGEVEDHQVEIGPAPFDKMDFVAFKPGQGTYVALSNGAGFDPKTLWSAQFQAFGTQDDNPRMVADVDADGRADVVGFKPTRGVWVALSPGPGPGFGPKTKWSTQFKWWGTQNQHPRMMGDVNGDGRADIIAFKAGQGVYVALSNGAGFDPKSLWTAGFSSPGSQDKNPRMAGDVDGDGIADIVHFRSGKAVHVALSNGAGFDPKTTWSNEFKWWGTQDQNPRMLADVNGDGLADIVAFQAGQGVYVALSNGAGFDPMGLWSTEFKHIGTQDNSPRMVGDVDADGRADLVASRAGRGVYVALSNGAAFDPRSLWSAEFKYYGTQNTAPRMLGNVDGS